MSKKKIVGLVFLVFVLMASMIVGYDYSKQMTVEEKRAEMSSVLTPELLAEILEPGDLAKILGPEGLLAIMSDGEYDSDYGLVDLAGSDPVSLGERVRVVEMQVLENGKPVGSQATLGYVYSQKYVIVPNQLFWIPFMLGGRILVFDLKAYSVKFILLSDPNIEDDWKKEELGEIKLMTENRDDVGFSVIERVDPIVGRADAPQYTFGKYEDLSRGKVLYRITQANNRIEVAPAIVSGVYTDKEKRNSINFEGSGDFSFPNYGGLLFAIRDGKFELVGLICVNEPMHWRRGYVYVMGLDINQIIEQIEQELK